MLHTELVLGGWSPTNKYFMATAYAKSDIGRPTEVLPLVRGMESPGGRKRTSTKGCQELPPSGGRAHLRRSDFGRAKLGNGRHLAKPPAWVRASIPDGAVPLHVLRYIATGFAQLTGSTTQ